MLTSVVLKIAATGQYLACPYGGGLGLVDNIESARWFDSVEAIEKDLYGWEMSDLRYMGCALINETVLN